MRFDDLDDPLNLPPTVAARGVHLDVRDQPNLGDPFIPENVDVRRLGPVPGAERETEAGLSTQCRHRHDIGWGFR